MATNAAARDRRLATTALAAAVASFVWLWASYARFWIDDAFISFRYARNWANGLGPVWNPGEAVEGYTNFLWMAISSLCFAVSDTHALSFIKLLGLLLGVFVLARVWSFPGPHGPARRLGSVLLASHPVFVANFGDGLETPLFCALAVEAARAVASPPSRASGLLAGLLVGALVATRPEALPLIAALPVLVVACAKDRRQAVGDFAARFLAVSLALVVLHLAWRLSFYGALLPNSFAAKATGSIGLRLESGVADLAGFFVTGRAGWPFATWLGLLLATLATLRGLRTRGRNVLRWLAVLWLFVGFRIAFDLWSGSEFMGVYRFLAPLLPFLCILADEGGRIVWRRSPDAGRAAFGLACAVALGFNVAGHLRVSEFRAAYQQGIEQAHMEIGSWLKARYDASDWIAVGDAGAIPFYSELPSIDLWGLNTAQISRLPGEYGKREGAMAWALAQQPRAFVLWSRDPLARLEADQSFRPGTHFGRELLGSSAFHDAYRPVKELAFRQSRGPGTGYYVAVFERRTEVR